MALLPPRSDARTLHVFDFDSTLVNTLGPEEGARAWLNATGSPWPHQGWWGRLESLSEAMPSSPGPAIGAYLAAVEDESALVVLLTGRRAHLAPGVGLHAERHGAARFHSRHFNDSSFETLEFKTRCLRRLIALHAGVAGLVIYEDRAPHAHAFQTLGAEFPHLQWTVHLVVPGDSGGNATPAKKLDAPPQPRRRSLPLPRTPAAASAPAAAPSSSPLHKRLPCYELLHYLRLCVALPASFAAAVPASWRANKLARDGACPEAHVTVVNSAELRALTTADPNVRTALKTLLRRAHRGPLKLLGLGAAVGATAGAASAFVVVDFPPGNWIRRQLGLPKAELHITLGFDPEDVHGAPKGAATLLRVPAGGWGDSEAAQLAMGRALADRVALLRRRAAAGAPGSDAPPAVCDEQRASEA